MANPQMPQMPGAAVVTDTLDFVKNLWGSMSVPGMGMPGITAPTMSVEELDKKINDLKAVEAWLNLNTSMLRGSIQALEVQRGTIATLKSMGASLAAAITQPGASEKTVFESVPYASAFFQQATPAAPEPKPAPAPAPAPVPEPAAAAPGDAGSQAAAQLANPSAWWNLLQDQFKQAVSTAMSPDATSAAAASFGSVSKAKPAASKPAKPAEAGTAAKAKAPLRKAPAKRAAPKAKASGKA
ncbi:PhaM family polyhydroxyalkanoate granule multifunctional regulatory protein [Janthinobacterium sp. GMG1]|uniref:PhaM family polyhydroxyalkanoate granule multifunctional regulatory protein n=1 Tax=Janthinobacterium sp. GMG1 TaxID=3096007 RepID=UPI002ACAAFBB|nr:PhaM family polyhydroxyalkanoate granule multifunctional regulatory protein [Janthinobacterium sp. GMG1]MDZ5633332.1 PhaM family polyhydroxyalkanoate granule multifunctional regulatory protein [Janthinobacterium sp. GMG1]